MKNKTEQEIALLRQFDQAWNVYGVLNFLQALVEKSNIIQIFEQEKGPDKLGTQSPLNISHFQDLLINGDLLGYPCSEGLFRLLMSTENTASNILPTTMNLSEHRAFPTYPNMSDYQARLERFSRGSSQVGGVRASFRAPRLILLRSLDHNTAGHKMFCLDHNTAGHRMFLQLPGFDLRSSQSTPELNLGR
ncbi:hypothetical protein LguiB_015038 [Lonicera macranthoides]